MDEKRGKVERFKGNDKTRKGTALEPVARALYERHQNLRVPPAVLHSNERDWQVASVDGITDSDDHVIEIKCGQSVFWHVARHRSPPKYYVGQLQHTLAVTGFEMIHLYCYLPDKRPILIEVERDQRYIDRLIEAEEEFVRKLEKKMKKERK